MNFKDVDKKYRAIPFWSWNEKLEPEETKRQVALMDEAGIGGYFMHARGGLLTEYMGEEWFDNVAAATEEGEKRGMHSWAYDENGWPSGFGGGKVNGLGLEYQQKYLQIKDAEAGDEEKSNTILIRDGKCYFYLVNEFYVDVINKKVIAEFIKQIYEPYYEKCGASIDGFFTDEPQISRFNGFPWSFILEEEFVKKYGYSIVDNIDALFLDKDNSRQVRIDYWQLVTDLFSEAYFKQIYDWCLAHNYGFTGHLVIEENLLVQLNPSGACMPHYEYFTMPGMDWLGRPVCDCLTPMQVSSVAHQMGKKQILSETFALAGHNVSHAELKRIFEWQMVHGITMLCTHLEGYSLRGIRKRDYPPAMYYQQPWWEDMKIFFDASSRIGMLLTEGKVTADTLLIHPQTTAWALYNGDTCPTSSVVKEIMEYSNSMIRDMRTLEDKHIQYHLGDETIIRRHARIENGRIIIGEMSYDKLILPTKYVALLPSTLALIEEFRRQGGTIITPEEAEKNPVCEINRLTYTTRHFDEFDMHYFVNTDNAIIEADIIVGNKQLIPETGEMVPYYGGKYIFAPYESLVLIDTHEPREQRPVATPTTPLSLAGEWDVKLATYNSLTLDRCDYYFDGELIERDGYVLNILPRINVLRRPVKLHQTYRFICEDIPASVYLATETPDIFEIEINGARVDKKDCGYFRDSAFRMLDISGLLIKGENVIELDSTIVQSDACYEHLDNCWTFEAMKNCLSYDMEVEPIYIVGNFGLRLPEKIEELDNDAYRIKEMPTIVSTPTTVDICNLDRDGFSQFAGHLTLQKSFAIEDTHCHVYLKGRGMNSIRISVNGRSVATIMNPPYEVDISKYLKVGDNEITLTILNNLRNMMGPHHLKMGEWMHVGPYTFFKESNVFIHPTSCDPECHDIIPHWDDDYCFEHFGLDAE